MANVIGQQTLLFRFEHDGIGLGGRVRDQTFLIRNQHDDWHLRIQPFQFATDQRSFHTICIQVKDNQVDAALGKAEDPLVAVACADGFPSVFLEQGAAKVQIDEVAANTQHAPGNTLSHCHRTRPPSGGGLRAFSSHIRVFRNERNHKANSFRATGLRT